MKLKTIDDRTLRQYLLGDLSPEEQKQVDLWLMSEVEAYDLLTAVEDDLVDEAIAGKLSRRERGHFEDHFLTAPERKRKLRFGRSFRRFITALTPKPNPKERSIWHEMVAEISGSPALGYAMLVTLIMVSVGIWSFVRLGALQRQFDSANAQIRTVGLERDELRKKLDESTAVTERLQAQLVKIEQAVGILQSTPAATNLLAVNLLPGLPRSIATIRPVKIGSNTQVVQFSLALLDDNFQSYNVALVDPASRELWTRNDLHSTTTKQGKAVVLVVPASLLSPGEFTLSLSGASRSGPPENISSFYFHVVR